MKDLQLIKEKGYSIKKITVKCYKSIHTNTPVYTYQLINGKGEILHYYGDPYQSEVGAAVFASMIRTGDLYRDLFEFKDINTEQDIDRPLKPELIKFNYGIHPITGHRECRGNYTASKVHLTHISYKYSWKAGWSERDGSPINLD